MNGLTLSSLLESDVRSSWREALRTPWPVSCRLEGNCKAGAGTAEPPAYGSPPPPEALPWRVREHREERGTATVLHLVVLTLDKAALELHLDVEIWPDHGAVRLTPTLRNAGNTVVRDLSNPCSWDAVWRREICAEPFVRTFQGGPWGDSAYPPVGYRVNDAQLLDHRQHWSTVKAWCPVEDGRPSQHTQPVMVIGDDREGGVVLALEWAGAYQMEAGKAQDFWGHHAPGDLLVRGGISGVRVDLEPGAEIPLPTTWLVFYRGDLDAGGQAWRRFFAAHLAPFLGGRPVQPMTCYNHWIAYEIESFTAADALREAAFCAEAGIEHLVFDAGWARGGFRAGNGDWEADQAKIPMGLAELARQVNAIGVKFGLWLEPEFAWKGSRLVADHPDWFLRLDPAALPLEQAWQADFCLMNFALPEVRDHWVNFIRSLHFESGIHWIRWDLNQPPGPFWRAADRPGREGLAQIAHVRGLYAALDRILEACPNLVLEQCAGGGTRVEPGMLRRAHTFWISDHSGSPHLCRFYQHGMNRLWPVVYANVNVVSGDGRLSPLEWLSHQCGSFGISSRLGEWSAASRAELRAQVVRFKTLRPLMAGDFHAPPPPARLQGKHEATCGGVAFHLDFDVPDNSILQAGSPAPECRSP